LNISATEYILKSIY